MGVSNLGELEAGWSFNDITRVIHKRPDSQYTYRKCFILLLEEYDDGQYKIVDYVNFDWLPTYSAIYTLPLKLFIIFE